MTKLQVAFWDGEKDGKKWTIKSMDDTEIEQARKKEEKRIGHPLPLDPKTGFPSFGIWENSVEIAGG